MKVSYVVTLDAPDVPDNEVRPSQPENARKLIHEILCREFGRETHVTVSVQKGLPLHPFPAS